MSFFYITNNKNKNHIIEQEYFNLFGGNIETINLNNELVLIHTPAYKKHTVKKKTKDGFIFGFGTFFTEMGFHEDALNSIEDLQSFLKQQEKGFFGHYVLIIEEKEHLYIITDKIGMINIYYTEKDGYFYISNDLISTSISSSNTNLSEQGAQQFILKESNIGKYTIFENIFRLDLGYMLKVTKNSIHKIKIHTYDIENLSFEQYIERCKKYFAHINNYDGKIATDMSGGFDTRLVASIGHKIIHELEANTNPNQFDNGIDESLSPIVSDKLNLPLITIPNKENAVVKIPLMLHGLAIGRDIIRSRQWPNRMKDKYECFNLILGGYGGETIRAKYNTSNSISKITQSYYRGKDAAFLFGSKKYVETVNDELNNYLFKELNLNNQSANWVYTVDRMRIWGGSQVLMASLYGDILHPFMDWYLINPIFSWDTKELEDGEIQQKIINKFAPQLEDVPLNMPVGQTSRIRITEKVKRKISKTTWLKYLAEKILRFIPNKKSKMDAIAFYKLYPKNNFDVNYLLEKGIHFKKIEQFGEISLISRLATVNEALKYVEKSKK